MSWLSNLFKKPQKPETPRQAVSIVIDWTNPQAKISKYFTVKEATFLPSWGICHIPTEQEKINILKMASAMDMVREFFESSISVHIWIRPSKVNCPSFKPNSIKIDSKDPRKSQKEQALAALDYNAFIGGAKASAHISGLAVDYDVKGLNCDQVRAKLIPKLQEFGLCMEDLPGSSWVHNDVMPPRASTGRFFKP